MCYTTNLFITTTSCGRPKGHGRRRPKEESAAGIRQGLLRPCAQSRPLALRTGLRSDLRPVSSRIIRRVYPGFSQSLGHGRNYSCRTARKTPPESKMIELEFDQSRQDYQMSAEEGTSGPVDHPLANDISAAVVAGTGRTYDNQAVPPPSRPALAVERYLSGVRNRFVSGSAFSRFTRRRVADGFDAPTGE